MRLRLVAAQLLVPALALAQAPARAPEVPAEGLYTGPVSCAGSYCHGSTVPLDVYEVDQNEYHVWARRDRHARAYETLFEERSRAIAGNLGLGDPTEERSCLACHALSVPAALQKNEIDPLDGVSCEACHGPASGWRDGHNAEDWDHRRSVAAGMTDLADLEVRAATCLGCHLGEPGRRVDHDLIAAGHPALPFELRNFSLEMPAHWRSGPEERLRSWAVGQAAALRTAAVELGRRARDGRWPDFSVLSCYACHREVETDPAAVPHPSPAASPGAAEFRARIGLPPWSPARWAVLRVLVERYAPGELAALDRAVMELARPVSKIAVPPAEVAAAADDLARRVEPLADRLGSVRWSPEEARAAALALTARAEALGADVHSAEQAVQGLYSLAGYLLATRPESARSGLVEALAELAGTVERPGAFDRQRFRDALGRVKERLGDV